MTPRPSLEAPLTAERLRELSVVVECLPIDRNEERDLLALIDAQLTERLADEAMRRKYDGNLIEDGSRFIDECPLGEHPATPLHAPAGADWRERTSTLVWNDNHVVEDDY